MAAWSDQQRPSVHEEDRQRNALSLTTALLRSLRYNKIVSDPLLQHEVELLERRMLLWHCNAVYYQTGVFRPFDGAPLCTIDFVTKSEVAAIARQELTDAGLVAWYEQIQ